MMGGGNSSIFQLKEDLSYIAALRERETTTFLAEW